MKGQAFSTGKDKDQHLAAYPGVKIQEHRNIFSHPDRKATHLKRK